MNKGILIQKFKEVLSQAKTSGGTEKYDLWIFGGKQQTFNADGVRLNDNKGGYFKTYKDYGFFGNCNGGNISYYNSGLKIYYEFKISSDEAIELRRLSFEKSNQIDSYENADMESRAKSIFG